MRQVFLYKIVVDVLIYVYLVNMKDGNDSIAMQRI